MLEMESNIVKSEKNHNKLDKSMFCFKGHFGRVFLVHFHTLMMNDSGANVTISKAPLMITAIFSLMRPKRI